MAKVKVDAGICGFSTEITAEQSEGVAIGFQSTCPHVACPLYSGFFKAIEVAAGLALPKDAHILVQKQATGYWPAANAAPQQATAYWPAANAAPQQTTGYCPGSPLSST